LQGSSFGLDGMLADRDSAIGVTLLQQDTMNPLEQRKMQMRLSDGTLTLIDEEQLR